MNRSLLRTNNESLKYQNDDIFKNFQSEIDKVTTLQADNKRMIKLLKSNEGKISYEESEFKKADEINNKVLSNEFVSHVLYLFT